MENIINYIVNNALVLIPVLYILGAILKGLEFIKDKYIPVILLPIGVLLAMLITSFDVNGFIQGVLVTGVAVYSNQVVKQLTKKED